MNDTVLMIYESFEYYSEASPAKQEKNFKGLPFWESRFFLANGKLAGHKHMGRSIESDYNATKEINEGNKILEYVKAQLPPLK